MINFSYASHTRYAFAFTETVAIATLMSQGLDRKTIKQKVVEDDLFQMRSQTSRQGAFRTIWQRLEKLPSEYIQLLATENADVRRFIVLFSIVLQHRLLREFIAEVVLDKLKQFDLTIKPSDVRVFFESKREESQVLAQWSEATYRKAASNTVLALIGAGLLQPIQPRGTYAIRATPVPIALKQQMVADGFEQILMLMLN
jgi:hypothetical protein